MDNPMLYFADIRFVFLRRPEGHGMPRTSFARLACAVVAMMIVTAPNPCIAESMSLDLGNPEWENGIMRPAYIDIDIDLGGPAASIEDVVIHVEGTPQEGTMVLCKGGGCDSFSCYQTLLSYFLDDRSIKSWVPLQGPVGGYDFSVPLQFADCYPDCYHPCSGQDIPPDNWDFLMDDGKATLRLELQGDLDGCGTMCTALNGIEQVTVKVDFVPLGGAELASWGAMKAVYR